MPTFTVHAAANAEAAPIPSASCSCATASISGPSCSRPLWMLAHRLWLVLLGYIVADGRAQAAFCALLGAPAAVHFFVGLLVALLVGFEAATLWRWTLFAPRLAIRRRRGRRRCRGWPSGASSTPGPSARSRRAAAGDRRRRSPRRCRRGTPSPLRRHRPVPRAGGNAVSVAIVDYGSGNLHSAAKAFERAAREAGARPADPRHQRSRTRWRSADRVVLPGVGAFADCRRGLDAVRRHGRGARRNACATRGRPFLGICVGMQLMAERGREYEVTPGLGWIAGEVDRIAPADPALKIPHMGWNTLRCRSRIRCSTASRSGRTACMPISCTPISSSPRDEADLVAQADYGGPVTADRRRATTWSARSSTRRRARSSGLRLIANFL